MNFLIPFLQTVKASPNSRDAEKILDEEMESNIT